MPSGAKKRKAAKKKKVNPTTDSTSSSASTLSLGEQDLKPIDEKESDGGSVSSPASQDHNIQQHPFTEEQDDEVEKREDTSAVRSFVTESLQESAATDGEAAVHIDSKLKSEEDFESKNVIIIEWEKELHDHGSSSRSSSSSSSDDDESRVLDKKIVVVETSPPVDSVNVVESLSEAVTQVNDSLVKETGTSPVRSFVTESVSVYSSTNSNEVVESGSKENGEKKLSSLDENITVSPVTDYGSKKEEDAVVSASNECLASSSLDANGSESAAQVDEDRSLLSINASNVGTSNGKEQVRYTETADCSIEQPLIASAPRVVPTTSWKGCCGLFELFSGSNR